VLRRDEYVLSRKLLEKLRRLSEVRGQHIGRVARDPLRQVDRLVGRVRIDGFGGLEMGFRLARELVESYWDNLYPQPDEDGLSTRTLPPVED
jgi:hypothetical protein